MRTMSCDCPRCDGDWETPAREERLCVQCGGPVLRGEAALWGPEGVLHAECAVEYPFLDPSRDELMAFVEQYLNDFVQYITELRNFRSGEVYA